MAANTNLLRPWVFGQIIKILAGFRLVYVEESRWSNWLEVLRFFVLPVFRIHRFSFLGVVSNGSASVIQFANRSTASA